MDVLVETVPQKETANFKKIIELYDAKKYKKGLKLSEKMIEKNPAVVEYRSLKALFWLNTPDQSTQALGLAKEVLLKNLGNPFCWQICGIIYRHAKNYKEAGKCYERALKSSPKNMSLLRDTANLQLHCRDYLSHRETRRRALIAHSEMHQNWISYALSLRLLMQFKEAVLVLDDLLRLIKNDSRVKAIELSNLLFFKAETLRDAGMYRELKDLLGQSGKTLLDEEKKLSLQLTVDEHFIDIEAVEANTERLLALNPNNEEVVDAFLRLSSKTSEEKLAFLLSKGSLCAALCQLKTDTLDDTAWAQAFQLAYSDAGRRFVPSFGRVVKQLGKNSSRNEAIDRVLKENFDSLCSELRMLGSTVEEDPTAELFATFVLAARLYAQQNFPEAFELVRSACEHTPSFEDAHILKAKLLLTQGKFAEAREAALFAAGLNAADRALTTQAVKILFRCNRLDEADILFKKFMRGSEEQAEKNLHDLQMMSFQHKRANALIARLQWVAGLRQFSQLHEHLATYFEDQFDFYSYAVRRFNVQPLFDLIKFNDEGIYQNKFFVKAMTDYLRALLRYKKFAQREEEFDEQERSELQKKRQKSPFALPDEVKRNASLSIELKPEFIEDEILKVSARLTRFAGKNPNLKLHEILFDLFWEKEIWPCALRSALHLTSCELTLKRIYILEQFLTKMKETRMNSEAVQKVADAALEKLGMNIASCKEKLKRGFPEQEEDDSKKILFGGNVKDAKQEALKLLENAQKLSHSSKVLLLDAVFEEICDPLLYYRIAELLYPDSEFEDTQSSFPN